MPPLRGAAPKKFRCYFSLEAGEVPQRRLGEPLGVRAWRPHMRIPGGESDLEEAGQAVRESCPVPSKLEIVLSLGIVCSRAQHWGERLPNSQDPW